jgi:alkanesulfonate monooxygenase SsuD/methylene tetrahydromethanopterin reductase-like flavin-dependent oxidoreductase (luciferase family)
MLPISGAVAHSDFAVVDAARTAEDLGFTSVWVGDHLAFHVPVLEAVVAATAAAVATRGVQVGFAVMLLALRHPAWTAKQLSSLQVVSGDRLVLGVGVGGENPEEWTAAGVPVSDRGARTDTLLATFPSLLRGSATALPGPYGVPVPPLLPAGAVPPLWTGGRSDAALERAARFADGWLAMWTDAQRIARARADLVQRAERYGRKPPDIGVLVFCSVDGDEDRAHREAARVLETQYRLPYDRMRRYVAAGSVDRVAAHLRDLVDAGARRLVLFPASPDWRTAYGRLAEVAGTLARA